MIWHNAQKPSRGTRWFIVAVLLFTLVMLYGATLVSPVGASAPQGVMYVSIECDKEGCQLDEGYSGTEPYERFCSIMAIETPSDACNILGPVYLYWRNTWSVYAFPSLTASSPA
jgi:hypothetical protein